MRNCRVRDFGRNFAFEMVQSQSAEMIIVSEMRFFNSNQDVDEGWPAGLALCFKTCSGPGAALHKTNL